MGRVMGRVRIDRSRRASLELQSSFPVMLFRGSNALRTQRSSRIQLVAGTSSALGFSATIQRRAV